MNRTTATASPTHYARNGQIGQLNAEWRDHYADRHLPKAWTSGALPHAPATYGELLFAVAGGTRDRADQLLHALLTLQRHNDPTAGRVVLQVMLGSTHRLIGTAAARHLDDPAAEAIEATWATITRYPLHRTSSVAANLALDSLKALSKPVEAPLPAGDNLPDHLGRHTLSGRLHAPDAIHADEEALELLKWAHDHHILDRDAITLLARVYLGNGPADYPALAQAYGVAQPALRKRISRAVTRLAESIATAVDSPLT